MEKHQSGKLTIFHNTDLNKNEVQDYFEKWAIPLFSFLIPISQFLSTKFLIFLLIYSLLFKRKKSFTLFKHTVNIIFYLIVLIVGLLYTEDLTYGLKVLETNSSLLALPIVIGGLGATMSTDYLKNIFYAFISGLFLICIVCLVNAAIQYSIQGTADVFLFYNLTSVIDSHPTYFAYYLIFAVTFCLHLLDDPTGSVSPLLILFFVSFFFLVLMLTGGQTAFMSLLLVCSFFLLKFIIDKKTKSGRITVMTVCIMIVCMFFVNAIDHEKRENILSDSWDRLSLWQSSIRANSNLLLGVGTGDYRDVLNNYYQTHGLDQFAQASLNSHNQFIQFFLSNGILGLIAIIILMGWPLYVAMKNDHPLGILILFPFTIYGMTEVFLGRFQGVVFFGLVHLVLTAYYVSLKPSFALKGT